MLYHQATMIFGTQQHRSSAVRSEKMIIKNNNKKINSEKNNSHRSG